jgi:hypothetical protein
MSEEKVKSTPSKEEIIKFFQDQIDEKKVIYELQELSTKLAVARAEELKALSFIAQMTNPRSEENHYEGGIPHTITEEDMASNPELKDQGIKVGDEVLVPNEEKPSKKRGLKTKN